MSIYLDAVLRREALETSTKDLHVVLSRALCQNRRIVDLERAPCPYGSSWWLEEIMLQLDDGSQVTLVFKNLDREALNSGAHRVKPAFVIDPTREPWVYRTLLSEAPAGPPKLWVDLNDPAALRHWLFLERIDGLPLTQVGDRAVWCSAARWLGQFHSTTPVPHVRGPLLRHDQEYHRRWLARALTGARGEKLKRLRALAPAHERALVEAFAPRVSLIHGEFYPSNVLVSSTGAVHPVDWEMAALGPALLDLAALLTGRWSRDDRVAMTKAYCQGGRVAVQGCPLDEVMRGVTACQLLLAVQWLGWATGWTAPADHRNDWLGEAERCAEELRV